MSEAGKKGTHAPASVWERLDCRNDAIIEASAGTGKTYAIQNIVCRLVCSEGYMPPEILVVTFTEKAAGELRDRIRKALAQAGRLTVDFDEMAICTIHSFCKRLLDEYAFESGIPMRRELCASSKELYARAADMAMRDNAFARAFGAELMGAPSGTARPFAKLAEDALDGFGTPKELAEHAGYKAILAAHGGDERAANEEAGMLAAFRAMIHRKCDAVKEAEGIVTYDDLVTLAADVVGGRNVRDAAGERARARLLESVRRRYRVALVDEFQDTDANQWEIFSTLFSSAANRVDGARPGFLVIVGDPKQAIYSFRGADVGVYCRARDSVVEATRTAPLALDATYRSTRSLVDAFKVFFADGGAAGWFASGSAGKGISYSEVSYPEGNAKFEGLAPEDEIAPVVLLESVPANVNPGGRGKGSLHFGNKKTLLPKYAEEAAAEMKRLRKFDGGSPGHPLRFRYSDMCVLVDTADDAAAVRNILVRHGIPYSQYKQRGVFASAEAEGVAALLDFISSPAARGRRQALLLSPLFNVRPDELDRLSPAFEAKFDALADRLAEYAARRDWARLFEETMNEDCSALAAPDGDICAFNRTRRAVRQIFDELLGDDALRRAGDAAALADALRVRRDGDSTAREEGSLYEKETAADCVQIMTIHASKGLQFPIVFVATGFGMPKKDQAEERRRLLYVAITRAEHRVYLPWSRRAWKWQCRVESKKKGAETLEGCGIGSHGADLMAGGCMADAIIRFAEKGVRFAGDGEAEGAERETDAGKAESAPDPASSGGLSREDCKPIEYPVDLKSRRLRWESFSSLVARLEAAQERDEEDDAERHAAALAPSLLPRTNISGTVFHEIMETLCGGDEERGAVGFANVRAPERDAALFDIIRGAMRRNGLENVERDGDSTERTLARMVRAALETPVEIGGETFRLSEIPRRDRLAEVDFVLASEIPEMPSARAAQPSPCDRRTATLNGQIDLIVRRGAKVYIIDWKTNSLASYDRDAVAVAMDDANYHLQYRIYAKAAEAWLRPRGLTLEGAAYVFARGGEAGGAAGIFSTRL